MHDPPLCPELHHPPSPRPDAQPSEPASPVPDADADDAVRRTKHTRVHKREKELCGLVTPLFLRCSTPARRRR